MHLRGILKAKRKLEFDKAGRTAARHQQDLFCNQIKNLSLTHIRADLGVDGISPLDLSTNQKAEGDGMRANREDPMANAEMELCQKLDSTILDDTLEAETAPTFDEFS